MPKKRALAFESKPATSTFGGVGIRPSLRWSELVVWYLFKHMLLAAILGEVLRAPSAGHEARLPPRRQSRRPLGGRLALSGVHSALNLRGGRGGGGGSTDGLRGGHSHGGEYLPCRVSERKLVFVGAPFCEGQNLAGADLAPEALRRSGLKKAVEMKVLYEDEDMAVCVKPPAVISHRFRHAPTRLSSMRMHPALRKR